MDTKSRARVLIVEDDWLQAADLAQHFSNLGLEVVGPATSITAGLRLAREADMAVLDINLSGQPVYPIADLLNERGVPMVFYTSYSALAIPERFRFASRLDKPATTQQIDQALKILTEQRRNDPDDIVALLPKMRLTARLMLHDPQAADRLVERALERAIGAKETRGDTDTNTWLNGIMKEVLETSGTRLLT